VTDPSRLVESPVFLLSPMRSGSTLVRVILNSHSMIRAPHELHLRTLQVAYGKPYNELAIGRLGLTRRELEYLLWDRLLHWELTRSGKQIIVDKTPGNALAWPRISECWPAARYIFLLRHPGAVFSSMCRIAPHTPDVETARLVAEYIHGVEQARGTLPGHTLRFEDLVGDPAATVRRICAFLGVPWEPQMLAYGNFDHGPFEAFTGDFSANISSGAIQPDRAPPDVRSLPPAIQDWCAAWGYTSAT
jgi:hypothetical protein